MVFKRVVEHEQDETMRVGKELLDRFEIEDNNTYHLTQTPRAIRQKYLKSSIERFKILYLQKQLQGYVSS